MEDALNSTKALKPVPLPAALGLARAVVERDDAEADERIYSGSPRAIARANYARDDYDVALAAFRAADGGE